MLSEIFCSIKSKKDNVKLGLGFKKPGNCFKGICYKISKYFRILLWQN